MLFRAGFQLLPSKLLIQSLSLLFPIVLNHWNYAEWYSAVKQKACRPLEPHNDKGQIIKIKMFKVTYIVMVT